MSTFEVGVSSDSEATKKWRHPKTRLSRYRASAIFRSAIGLRHCLSCSNSDVSVGENHDRFTMSFIVSSSGNSTRLNETRKGKCFKKYKIQYGYYICLSSRRVRLLNRFLVCWTQGLTQSQ